jgi:Fe-S cluster biosynthesis and repair protein YggX
MVKFSHGIILEARNSNARVWAEKNEPLGVAPIPTELGQKIGAEICKDCWA